MSHEWLSTCTDERLAGLTSPGLVGRARKDLERDPPTWLSREDLRLDVGGRTVRLEHPLERARCDCPAGRGCRHVLAAVMFAREEWARQVAQAPDATHPEGSGLPGTLGPALGVGPGLAEEASGSPRPPRGLPAAPESATPPGSEAPEPAPRTRRRASATRPEPLLAAVGRALEDLVTVGLSRLSPALRERLHTLAASAYGADLPRLGRQLKRLSGQVEAYLAREAGAEAGLLLSEAARLEALRQALLSGPADLGGEHRDRYELVGELELVGLGAAAWVAPSGWAGLTLYFWSAGRFLTWSDVRPAESGFRPEQRFQGGAPWDGTAPPCKLPGTRLRLEGARVSPRGRISSSQHTLGRVLGPVNPAREVPAVERWGELLPVALEAFAPGLAGPQRSPTVWLAPARVLPARFDRLRQESVRPISDGARLLPVRLGSGGSPQLERWKPEQPRILGRLTLGPEGIAVEPVTLWNGASPLNLQMGASTAAEDEEDSQMARASASGLGRLLGACREAAAGLGEGGLRGEAPVNLQPLVLGLERAGLARAAACLRALAGEPTPRRLLAAMFVLDRLSDRLAVREAFP